MGFLNVNAIKWRSVDDCVLKWRSVDDFWFVTLVVPAIVRKGRLVVVKVEAGPIRIIGHSFSSARARSLEIGRKFELETSVRNHVESEPTFHVSLLWRFSQISQNVQPMRTSGRHGSVVLPLCPSKRWFVSNKMHLCWNLFRVINGIILILQISLFFLVILRVPSSAQFFPASI